MAESAIDGRLRHEEVAHRAEDVGHYLRGTSLNRALEVVGDWWSQRILRESFLGVRHFEKLQQHLGIPRQTLSLRLKHLVAHRILDDSGDGYRLAPAGLALYPWALMMWRWTRDWGSCSRHPEGLLHRDCGCVMTPVFACSACLAEVTLRDVDYRPAPLAGAGAAAQSAPGAGSPATAQPARRRHWTGNRAVVDPAQAGQYVAFVTADRRTHLILSAIFLGCRTYDRLARETGFATNILAQRLALLVDAGFLVKRRSASDGRRFDYGLTPRGRDVFSVSIALVQWADRWLPAANGPPMIRHHRSCGARLHARVVCSACRAE
ncbi:MAG: winged helix-turn-helix transcriptional regulator [Lautropia sp.]